MSENEKHLPWMPKTERLLLASMMFNPVLRDAAHAAPELFYTPAYRTIAAELVRMHEAGEDPEDQGEQKGVAAVLATRFEADGRLEAVGGWPALLDLASGEYVSIPAHVDERCLTVLRDCAERRRVLALSRRIVELAEAGADCSALLAELRDGGAVVEPGVAMEVDKHETLRLCIGRLEDMIRRRSSVTGLTSGYDALDEMLGGWRPGTLTVLGARPSMGKTAWGLNVAWRVSQRLGDAAGSVLFVSAEMGVPNLLERLLAQIGSVDIKGSVKRGMPKVDRQNILRSVRAVKDGWLEFLDANGADVDAVCREVEAVHRKRPVALLVVDYLQLLRCERMENQGRYAVVTEVSRRLAWLARGLGIPVLALAQLSRESAKSKDKTPGLTDLRESGAIEQDADAVLLLHRPDYYEKDKEPETANSKPIHRAKVIVAKNREGATGAQWFRWEPEFQRFTPECEVQEDEQKDPF